MHIGIKAFHDFLNCFPLLTSYGFGTPPRVNLDDAHAELENAAGEFDYCCEYLATRKKCKMINREAYSDRGKHDVELWIEGTLLRQVHISEGSFIAAAIYEGFDYQKSVKKTGVYLNLAT